MKGNTLDKHKGTAACAAALVVACAAALVMQQLFHVVGERTWDKTEARPAGVDVVAFLVSSQGQMTWEMTGQMTCQMWVVLLWVVQQLGDPVVVGMVVVVLDTRG